MLTALIKTMRPRQWVKNVVIFAALVFDRQLGFNNLPAMLRTLAGFLVFCLLSGLVYIINDLMDVEADRQHPDKRRRPIASGDIPIPVARLAAFILLAIVFPLAYWLSPAFALFGLAYFLLNLAYSRWIKHWMILDVFSIALGFILRVGAGMMLIQVHRFSPWLFVVTSLGALYIGFGKRRAELALLEGEAIVHRKVLGGYTIPLLDQYITILAGTTLIAYSLYTFSADNLPNNNSMMLTIPFVLYGIFRYLQLVQDDKNAGAPEEILMSDRPLQVAIILWGITVLSIFYLF